MSETGFTEVKYRCSNPDCGAEDLFKHVNGTALPPVINCWHPKCRAGYQVPPQRMMELHIGMYPVAK